MTLNRTDPVTIEYGLVLDLDDAIDALGEAVAEANGAYAASYAVIVAMGAIWRAINADAEAKP